MLSRRKNLLEAFKKSDAAGAPPSSSLSSTQPNHPRPVAPSPSTAPPGPLFEGTTRFERTPSARSAGVGRQPAPALILIGLVLAFVLGFVSGRGSGGATQAGAKGAQEQQLAREASVPRLPPPSTHPRAFQERPSSGGVAAPAEPAPAASARLEESALFDASNAYTVVVAAYSSTNQDLAWATFEHLRDLGLPVFPPVASKNLILVVVGAAPTSGELAQTESTVKALTRDGQKAYETAYRARIDALIPRTPKKGPETP